MKIVEDKQNPLFKRREVKVVVESGKNPALPEVLKMIAEEFKSSEEKIEVKGIRGKFGRNTFLLTANIYETKEDKEKTVIKTRKQRKKEKEEASKVAEESKEKPEGDKETKPEEKAEVKEGEKIKPEEKAEVKEEKKEVKE